ncbi:MAG: metallophosphoesterase [Gemmatimonadaceae bacterium]|jgi:3',5'-cyclic AMP phosphodiesterase CpdA|nr:metallophosphoesterase [Gemmatimonadaceae bacterium]
MPRILHVSDLHFGRPAVPLQIDAIEQLIQAERFDVVAVSGDVSQRARSGEFQRAQVFLRDARRVSEVIVVPGNHDVAWWRAPMGLGDTGQLYEDYRTYVHPEVEPVLDIAGARLVGLNTSHGITRRTLTWNMRDLSVIGDVTRKQLVRLAERLDAAPDGAARVVVMHHNPVRGELSQRHGLKHTSKVLGAFAEMGVDLVLCGHDHQEAIHFVEHTRKGTVISTAGTVSSRSRGGRPSSVNAIDVTDDELHIVTWIWEPGARHFAPGPVQVFPR